MSHIPHVTHEHPHSAHISHAYKPVCARVRERERCVCVTDAPGDTCTHPLGHTCIHLPGCHTCPRSNHTCTHLPRSHIPPPGHTCTHPPGHTVITISRLFWDDDDTFPSIVLVFYCTSVLIEEITEELPLLTLFSHSLHGSQLGSMP